MLQHSLCLCYNKCSSINVQGASQLLGGPSRSALANALVEPTHAIIDVSLEQALRQVLVLDHG